MFAIFMKFIKFQTLVAVFGTLFSVYFSHINSITCCFAYIRNGSVQRNGLTYHLNHTNAIGELPSTTLSNLWGSSVCRKSYLTRRSFELMMDVMQITLCVMPL